MRGSINITNLRFFLIVVASFTFFVKELIFNFKQIVKSVFRPIVYAYCNSYLDMDASNALSCDARASYAIYDGNLGIW